MIIMKRTLLGVGLLAAAQAGCVTGGATWYEPSADEYGPAAYQQPASASYGVPADAPKGTVYVVSLGGEDLPVGNASALFLHVRIAAENTGDASAWRFDPNEQRLRLDTGADTVAAAF